jgi:uncharacterized protein (TIGR02996 family)
MGELRASRHEEALRSLLEYWRSGRDTRHPRVADLIDRVSAIVTEARGPIRARTVKARTEAWLAIAAQKDVADVGRLLATPWPGTWTNAMPVLEALTAFPSDPRIALALVELVEAAPYDTWTSENFYHPLLWYVEQAMDVRTLPMLRRDLEREKSTYWRQGTKHLVASAAAQIERGFDASGPKLSSEDAAIVDELESIFASDRTRDEANTKSEAEFLEAIYAAPDDDTVRAVFADWLTERGDPRGELIALQLAGASTEKMRKREASLLKKHGKAWVGDLETGLSKHGRVFERGFLARAILDTDGDPKTPPKVFSDVAWATVWSVRFAFSIEWRSLGAQLLALPSMRWVKDIAGVSLETMCSLARAEPRPRIESIEVDLGRDRDDAFRAAAQEIAATRALPGLKTLAVHGDADAALLLLDGPLGAQLERFRIIGPDVPILPLARWFEARSLPLREILVTDTRQSDTWAVSLTVRRDERGRFTQMTATEDAMVRWVPTLGQEELAALSEFTLSRTSSETT